MTSSGVCVYAICFYVRLSHDEGNTLRLVTFSAKGITPKLA